MNTRHWMLMSFAAVVAVMAAFHFATAHAATGPQVVTPPEPEPQPGYSMGMNHPAVGDSTPAEQTAGGVAGTKLSYNACNVDGPYIAMTFDDGPRPGQTDRLLDMLKERGIHVTFFVIGENAAQYPDLIKRMIAEGHEVGNHSWDHPAFTKLSADGVASQISRTDDAIVAGGAPKPILMRPPYGATNSTITHRINEEFGKKVIMWTVDPLDWKVRNSAHVTSEILKGARPGAIVLSHDIHATTVDAMPGVLDALKEKGYKFVTVSELIAMDRPQAASTPTPAPAPAKPKKSRKHPASQG